MNPSRYSVIRKPVLSDCMPLVILEVLVPHVYGAFRLVTLRIKLVCFFAFRRSGDRGWGTGTRGCYHLVCGRGSPLLEEKAIVTIRMRAMNVFN